MFGAYGRRAYGEAESTEPAPEGASDGYKDSVKELALDFAKKVIDPDPHYKVANLKVKIRNLEAKLSAHPQSWLAPFWRAELDRARELLKAAERSAGVQRSEEEFYRLGQVAIVAGIFVAASMTVFFLAKARR